MPCNAQPHSKFIMNHVALIAGMGPDAGADALMRFLEACRGQIRQANRRITDQAYPPHVLVQYPIPDRTAALLDGGESPVPGLVSAMGAAKAAGAGVFGIACNTAHFWYDELARLFPDLDIVHIAHEAARTVSRSGAKTCAVLATRATQRGGLYATALAGAGVGVVEQTPAQEEAIHQAIFDIKSGKLAAGRAVVQQRLAALLESVDAVVLGCTELGLVVDTNPYQGRVIDAATSLAEALAAKAYDTYTPPKANLHPQPSDKQ